MKVCIASLNFSPAHWYHVVAYGKLLSELGVNVCFLLDEEYKKITNEWLEKMFFDVKEISGTDIIIFWNVSVDSPRLAKYLKNKGTKIVYVYHEPPDLILNYLKEGPKELLKLLLARHFSLKLLKLSDAVIVPSEYARKLYIRSDFRYCRNVLKIPLLFDDEYTDPVRLDRKIYFSYIGNVARSHNFSMFLHFIKYLYKSGVKMYFQIATRSNIEKYISGDNLLQEMLCKEVLRISHGRILSTKEINEAYESSFCIWNVYNRSTQSGVLPKAFMFGSPVLANTIGSFPEFVQDGYNGFLIKISGKTSDYEILKEKLEIILRRLPEFSYNARETFKKMFYYKNYAETMSLFLKEL